ncbi:MAG: hypothetical protein EOQ59_04175 [Mesorhizobium sp.]|nr:MAG: hypothetical protein EOQ59_04175 [Mesorhizobium sp.]TIR06741.1 MAG: hypothetical protein E5X32_15775 [Mesorhizobium sp.]
MDEVAEIVGAAFGLLGMDLVPEVPSEERAAAAPSAHREFQPCLDGAARGRADQKARGLIQRAAVPLIIGVMTPVPPLPKCIERGEQYSQAVLFTETKKIVPQPHHGRDEATERPLEVAVADLSIFQHQPEAGDAALPKPAEVSLHAGYVLAPEQPI